MKKRMKIKIRKLEDVINDYIRWALKFHKGNKTHAAIALGMSIRTLRNHIATAPALEAFRITRMEYERRGKHGTEGTKKNRPKSKVASSGTDHAGESRA